MIKAQLNRVQPYRFVSQHNAETLACYILYRTLRVYTADRTMWRAKTKHRPPRPYTIPTYCNTYPGIKYEYYQLRYARLNILTLCDILYTDLWIENGNVDVIVTDQRSQPVPDVRHLQQYGLHHVIVGYQFLSSGPVYDVGRPSQRDPVIGHRRFRFHRFQYFLLAVHHQTYYASAIIQKKQLRWRRKIAFRFIVEVRAMANFFLTLILYYYTI